MNESADSGHLAALLSELKERSGFSYTELARRTYTTSSSLHRYCTGRSVPRDYGMVTAIARECGATAEELRVLAVHWAAATADGAARSEQCDTDPAVPEQAAEPSTGPAASSPAAAPADGWLRRPRTAAIAALVLLAGLLIVVGRSSGGRLGHASVPSTDSGDDWTWSPAPVRPATFGVTLNSNTGAMPSFRVGSVRFWDSGTRWADLEPRRGVFRFTALDRLVDGAGRAGEPALLTLGGTPGWAAPNGPKSLYADGSRTAPPDRLADWDAFIRVLAGRYRHRLEAYELWDTATDTHFYSGSARTLAQMVRRAARIIHTTDPRARVVCPSMGRLRTPGGPAFLRAFARYGGYQACDVAALKVHQDLSRERPEAMAEDVAGAHRALHAAGVGEPLWITGPDYDVSTQPALHGARARDYAARLYLVALYERKLHVNRFYFYDWGGTRIPIVLQPEGRAPTSAARGIGRLQRWLAGARIGGCSRRHAAGRPDGLWRCRFTGVPDAGSPGHAQIAWTSDGTASLRAGPHGATVHRLDGGTSRARAGDPIPVTGEPELITGSPVRASP